MKHKVFVSYLIYGLVVTMLFGVVAAAGIQMPKVSSSSGFRSYGRSYGGSWGGGK